MLPIVPDYLHYASCVLFLDYANRVTRSGGSRSGLVEALTATIMTKLVQQGI